MGNNAFMEIMSGTKKESALNEIKRFSTADALSSMNTRKLQTTAYLKLKENFTR